MPATSARAVRRRSITSVTPTRSLRGLSVMSSRPLLSVTLVPSTPMNDDRPATAGSLRITRPSACWRAAMAENETF